MSAGRRKKIQERAERFRKLAQRRGSSFSAAPLNLLHEIEHIVRCAQNHDSRCVAVGPLLFFSSESGDAWVLDLEDDYARCLARDGVPQPSGLVETETQFGIDWKATFTIDGDLFTVLDRESGKISTIVGYPTWALQEFIDAFHG